MPANAITRLSETEARAWRGFQRMAVGVSSRLHRKLVEAAGLSLPDYEVLTALAGSDDGTVRAFELGDELHWEKSRLSHHLKRMEARGLVARTVCQSDGRGLWISLTDTGRQAWAAAMRAHDEEVRRLVVDRIDSEQLEALARIADAVVRGMPADDLCDP